MPAIAMERIDHGQLYSLPGGVYTNGAEEFFSRLRRAEIGHHHHIAGTYLVRYAQESAWREDHRRVDNGDAGSGRSWGWRWLRHVGGLVRVLAANAQKSA